MFGTPKKEQRRATVDEITAANKTINSFFAGRSQIYKKVAWFNPEEDTPLGVISEIKNSLKAYFKERKWFNGGSIPDELLYTAENFHLINNISLMEAVEMAYTQIGEQKTLAQTPYKKTNGLPVEVAIALKHLHECESKNIPQDHIGGLLILYLMLCERVVLL